MPIKRLMPLFLILLLFTTPCLAQWAEAFYDCVCYQGTRTECLKKVDLDYPELRSEFAQQNSNKEDSANWLSQMRAAQIILEQRYQVRMTEEGSCLQSAIIVVKSAIGFSLSEKRFSPARSFPFLKSLYNLSRDAYQWAQNNCFNQSSGQYTPLNIILPNPQMCRFHQ
jgi:hypothetical protein